MSRMRIGHWVTLAVGLALCGPAMAEGPAGTAQATPGRSLTRETGSSDLPGRPSQAEAPAPAATSPTSPAQPTTKATPAKAPAKTPVADPVGKSTPPIKSSESVEGSDDLLLMPEPYYYESLGRRDIFVSLISDEYEKDNPNPRPVSDELRVVGILWAEKDRFALLETEDGRSMILREGDSLGDGEISQILPDRVVVHVTEYGSSRTKSLPLVQGGGWNENPRSRSR